MFDRAGVALGSRVGSIADMLTPEASVSSNSGSASDSEAAPGAAGSSLMPTVCQQASPRPFMDYAHQADRIDSVTLVNPRGEFGIQAITGGSLGGHRAKRQLDDRLTAGSPGQPRNRSASMAAMQPVPAAVMAWRYTWPAPSPPANTPRIRVAVE